MSSQSRLDRAYKNAKNITFNDTSKFILFSDCHRGDNSFADEFANNRNIYIHALKHYFKEGFTYFELGDGDELWENINFSMLLRAHKDVYDLLQLFYRENRLHMIWGNHDMVYKDKTYVKKHLSYYLDHKLNKEVALFPGITFEEAIVLKHEKTSQEIFLLHGHQADFMNYNGWRIHRFLVRILWRPLQVIGILDPTSPAHNYKETIRVERRVKRWILKQKNKLTVMGHTHRPRFPEPGGTALFNDGSCVHPRCITGIEIDKGTITLIKWQISTTEEGFLRIVRSVLEGPTKLTDFVTE
ncbi:metallophosphoesterase family protein [Aquimarina sp. U1-2]|uniref:metallophosphoesterase family protein n=1 Tax=Aquimarina sp. U1-2 TaxID=2823141 RepID=UPI001AEC88C6|nr:metallophosphoesterase [Aquimarina sp. U1-2]MBP2831442.1 metallophosphoesterase family protein [Aquimarina sp. U1-2]